MHWLIMCEMLLCTFVSGFVVGYLMNVKDMRTRERGLNCLKKWTKNETYNCFNDKKYKI